MSEPKPLPPIKFAELSAALLSRADTLVPMWLPGGTKRGHEWVCASLSGGAGTSCSVNLVNGQWADFAGDERGGDLVSLYAAIHGLSMGKAALDVARDEGLEDVAGVQPARGDVAPKPPRPAPPPAPPKAEPEGWKTIRPVPATAPAPTFWHAYRNNDKHQDVIDHLAEYRTGDDLHGYVVRFVTSTGDKETLPYTWCISARDGACKWHWKHWDELRPLYVPARRKPVPGDTVVLVEGEKKAEALQAVLDQVVPGIYLVCSWAGGCKAWKKADWSWLQSCTVLLWPDCDGKREPLTKKEAAACLDEVALEIAKASQPLLPVAKQPGMAAMLGIGALLRAEQTCTVQMLPIPEPLAVPDGWDCFDAIHTDGWDCARVLIFFGSAFALPEGDGVAPAGKADAAKKIDGLVDTAGGGNDDSGTGADAAEAPGAKPIPWWLKPYWDADKCRWFVSRKLVIAALNHDDLLAPVLGLNELSNNIEARHPWPWPHGRVGPVTSTVDLALGKYLSDSYGLPSINRAALNEAIETVAHERPFHPVRDYLQGLQHDGTARIDKWLIFVLGESPETLKPAMREYLTLVGRYWLLGMVNRVMEPGCKFDYCPVLEGPGGLGKSTMVEVLASSEFFSDAHFDLTRGKDGQEQVQGRILYELAELASFGKAEIQLIKAFISSKVDRYRPSYGRVVESYPRQCVLVGTTNENTYLRDRTGNRRFWPVPVKCRINIPWLTKWRDQLLAEAFALYQQGGVVFTPSPEDEARLFVPMQESRLVETAVLSELLHVLTRDPVATSIGAIVNNLADFVTMAQLTLALGVDAAKSNAVLEGQIRSWLDHEGWDRVKKQINGARAWGYARPKDWPPVEAANGPDDAMDGPPVVAPPINEHEGDDDAPF